MIPGGAVSNIRLESVKGHVAEKNLQRIIMKEQKKPLKNLFLHRETFLSSTGEEMRKNAVL
jgi:hypothetical protein